ncbi:MAG: AmmeMemoRadiSam system radical SAM enzyme [Candidatus Omnitrophica bacterium]|nr:AmmeMemoRadiSam system radical SAM enzyme [Candidatus Omnitrophota bacterium]
MKGITRRDFIKKGCIFCLGLGFSDFIFSTLKKNNAFALIGERRGMREAKFYKSIDEETVQCLLCPRGCTLSNGQRSFCRVREPEDGKLYSLVYGLICSSHIDPIEKKPVFHMLPGSTAFSIATAGCNLRCKFCQNWAISQVRPEEVENIYIPPEDLVKEALHSGCASIAYTYSEPTVFYEYVLDTAKLAREAGIKNISKTSGFINPEPAKLLAGYLDAANIDLKGFDNQYLEEMCSQKLEPLLKAIKTYKDSGVWVELTNLVLPGLNDDMKKIQEMCRWIKSNLGVDTPLHFSRFTPMYKMTHLAPTPVSTLEEAKEVALGVGLNYVYIGNVPGHEAENTYCPSCRKLIIGRRGFFLNQYHLNKNSCGFCGRKIAGIWPDVSPLTRLSRYQSGSSSLKLLG